jgi:GxxExxY protein
VLSSCRKRGEPGAGIYSICGLRRPSAGTPFLIVEEEMPAEHADHAEKLEGEQKDLDVYGLLCFLRAAPFFHRDLTMEEFPFKDETYRLLGACFEVYREKGCGFLEAVYQECLELELTLQSIPFVARQPLAIHYKGFPLKQHYAPDFICFGGVLVEIKAVSLLVDEHRAQVLNYLHAAGLKVALLINFGHHPRVEYERFANTRGR